LAGFLICLVAGCALVGAFYGLGSNQWGKAEYIYEGVFAIVASLIISLMGAALLRVSKMQEKWRLKLAKALEAKSNSITHATAQQGFKHRFKLYCERYAMFILPFITILREGVEAILFIGGVSLGLPASSIPLATICGLLAGVTVGLVIYLGGNRAPLQLFLIVSTCFLYLVAAGLFSRGIWFFETDAWNKLTGGDSAETGSGAGSYDIRDSVWHVNCCNPGLNGGGGWGIFNAIFGWQNSATYGSVIGYNVYWIVVILGFVLLRFKEKKGRMPFMKAKESEHVTRGKDSGSDEESSTAERTVSEEKTVAGSKVRDIGEVRPA
jgi:high-affinity iron transporter